MVRRARDPMTSSRRAALLWLAALLAGVCLAGLTAELLHGGWVVSADRSIEAHVLLHQRQSLDHVATVLSWLGEPVTVGVVVVLATVVLAVRRDRLRAVTLPLAVLAAVARVYDFAHFLSAVVASLLVAAIMIAVVEAMAETVSTRRRAG
jgi:hypothetical protein